MNKILLDKANINNLTSLWKLMGARSQDETDDLWESELWPNRCWIEAYDSDLLEKMTRYIDRISDRHILPLWACAKDATIAIEKMLKNNSFEVLLEQTAMVLELKDYFYDASELDLLRVSSNEEVAIWTDIVSQSFEYHVDLPVIEKLVSHADIHLLLACVNGRAVATALLYVTGNVIGVHQVGVLAEYRGQGIARMLMKNLISKCGKLSASYVTLQASSAGENLYKSLGFKRQFLIRNYQRL